MEKGDRESCSFRDGSDGRSVSEATALIQTEVASPTKVILLVILSFILNYSFKLINILLFYQNLQYLNQVALEKYGRSD